MRSAEIMKNVTTTIEGQRMSAKNQERGAATIAAKAAEDDILEAASFTEEIIAFFNDRANAQGLTLEQRIFAFQLAAINLRQHLGAEHGGPRKFDEVGNAAWDYFNKHK